MSEFQTTHPSFLVEPLDLTPKKPSTPFSHVRSFDLETMHNGFHQSLLIPLLSRPLRFLDIPGFINVYGEGASVPIELLDVFREDKSAVEQFFIENEWNENGLKGITPVFELGFQVKKIEEWKRLQEYYLSLRLGRTEVYMDCEGGMEEFEILPRLEQTRPSLTISITMWDENGEEIDAPFDANPLALSFLEITPHKYEDDRQSDDLPFDLPSPNPTSKRPLVLV